MGDTPVFSGGPQACRTPRRPFHRPILLLPNTTTPPRHSPCSPDMCWNDPHPRFGQAPGQEQRSSKLVVAIAVEGAWVFTVDVERPRGARGGQERQRLGAEAVERGLLGPELDPPSQVVDCPQQLRTTANTRKGQALWQVEARSDEVGGPLMLEVEVLEVEAVRACAVAS